MLLGTLHTHLRPFKVRISFLLKVQAFHWREILKNEWLPENLKWYTLQTHQGMYNGCLLENVTFSSRQKGLESAEIHTK